MKKITPRSIPDLDEDDPITVHFTRIQGRRGGQSVTHESEVATVDSPNGLSYQYNGETFSFELSTGYVREDGDVIGRDGRVEIET